ncbi:hypothetical protein H2203_007313 [Taxawa tesnikishii (nom. ined.)]|nr:hypothetical protein H2203_007313 [Dothideales sp. JES 119]
MDSTTTPSRRSGRRRQSSKKYTTDPFEGLDIDDSGNESQQVPADEDDATDAEFAVDAVPSPEAEDDLEMEDAFEPEASEGRSDAGEDFVDEDEPVNRKAGRPLGIPSEAARPAARDSNGRRIVTTNRDTRGLHDPLVRTSKEARRLHLFGSSRADQEPAVRAHYKWSEEPSLPSRKPTLAGFGGFSHGFYRSENTRKKEAAESWNWYDEDGGKEAFRDLQQCKLLDEAQGRLYLPQPGKRDFLMGAYNQQRLFSLDGLASMKLDQGWSGTNENVGPRQQKHGFMLNAGAKVHSMEWAPNQTAKRQFLVVSTVPLRGRDTGYPPFEEPTAPAFTPQRPYRSALQIWEFTEGQGNYIDTSTAPRLVQVVCTDWGDVKEIKFCPVPRIYVLTADQETINLGLLAGVWGDGITRVLDISVPVSTSLPTQYIHCRRAAFSSIPPNTVCTCVTWLSSTGLAAGCSNGNVAIYNLPTSLAASARTVQSYASMQARDPQLDPQTITRNCTPVLYSAIAPTYILTLTSYLTQVTSAGGFGATTTIPSQRSRFGKVALAWHDIAQMTLTVDENFTLIGNPLRQFFGNMGLSRFKSGVTCIAVSPVHPFLMAGTLGGEAVANNPIRRTLDSKTSIWNLIWFAHDWRSGRAPVAPPESTNAPPKPAATPSKPRHEGELSRFLEGFHSDRMKLFNADDALPHKDQGIMYSTIHEMETAVTAVCWNPNIHVAGWCAAGMADGLLRVEDVAV